MIRSGTHYAVKKIIGGMSNSAVDYKKIKWIFLTVVILITAAFAACYASEKFPEKDWVNKTALELFGFTSKFSLTQILIGMVSNIVFAIFDNGALFSGMGSLEPFFPQQSGGSEPIPIYKQQNTRFMITGHKTIRDMVGSFLGVFVSNGISNIININESPIWAEIIGIIIGCLVHSGREMV